MADNESRNKSTLERLPDNKKWYLIYTKPRGERQAKENLERQGYFTYLPMALRNRRRNSKSIPVVDPFFPRYLFIALDTETENWAPIRSTLGVTSMVRFGQSPARVPADLIAFLLDREDERGHQVIPAKNFKPGERIRISEGPLTGYEGIYQTTNGMERVTVLIKILEKERKITIKPKFLESA
ncbi:MAG: transcription/translation regulatory transformer protein RfaH [Acidiferrobacteraceae bacterium]|jgi:transcriptional antiterminator RfaH|nr:transcription/translation regulatory transformer protein RfaH [Acidiferrobacteraceae bacterium]MDP6725220.1 transcription/translation regulatory transformer protein RfaH [Arenicellales bacterium]|tara:strand:- start:4853 stop:5401 length:549 start_codon:yes stop_codon:yes gene_type:complete